MTKKTLLQRSVGYVQMANNLRKIKRTTDETVIANARNHLVLRMGKLRGLPQKIGQILSMSDDPLQAESIASLNDQVEPIPFEEIQPILEKVWQGSIESVVKEIDPYGRAAS